MRTGSATRSGSASTRSRARRGSATSARSRSKSSTSSKRAETTRGPTARGRFRPAACSAGDVRADLRLPRTVGTTIIGGAFAPPSFGNLGGQYFFADNGVSTICSAVPTPARDDIATPVNFVTGAQGPVDIVFGPDGALYYVAINARLRAAGRAQLCSSRGRHRRLSASLVPAYAACTAPNRTHGAPLSFSSCTPPAQQSGLSHRRDSGRERRRW